MEQPQSNQVLQEIEALGKKHFLPIVGSVKGKLLERLVQKYKPKNALEIGTLVGYSAILITRSLPEHGKLTTLEASQEAAQLARQNLIRAGLSDKVKIFVGDALLTLNNFNVDGNVDGKLDGNVDGKFDFVFIDASKHEYLEYLKILELKRMMKEGCMIVADNAKIFAHDMQDYLRHVRNSLRYESSFHDFGEDGMEVSVFYG